MINNDDSVTAYHDTDAYVVSLMYTAESLRISMTWRVKRNTVNYSANFAVQHAEQEAPLSQRPRDASRHWLFRYSISFEIDTVE